MGDQVLEMKRTQRRLVKVLRDDLSTACRFLPRLQKLQNLRFKTVPGRFQQLRLWLEIVKWEVREIARFGARRRTEMNGRESLHRCSTNF